MDDIFNYPRKIPGFIKYTPNILLHQIYINPTQPKVILPLNYTNYLHSDMDSLYLLTQKKYPDLSSLEDQLTEAGKYILYYFPEDTIDKITTFHISV